MGHKEQDPDDVAKINPGTKVDFRGIHGNVKSVEDKQEELIITVEKNDC